MHNVTPLRPLERTPAALACRYHFRADTGRDIDFVNGVFAGGHFRPGARGNGIAREYTIISWRYGRYSQFK